MNKVILIFVLLASSYSCKYMNWSPFKNQNSDTILNKNQLEITVKYHNDDLDSIYIYESNAKIINDSMIKLPEFIVLNYGERKYHETNFVSPFYMVKEPIKYYKINGDTLFCDLYFGAKEGDFYFGDVNCNGKNIILYYGEHVYYGDVLGVSDEHPVFERLKLKIHLPPAFVLNQIFYQWRDNYY
jgi:hypothetical protein